MYKKLRGMYDCRPKFTCRRKYQYWGLLGAALVALSFSQLRPVQAQADATGTAAEQVVTQSNRDSVGDDSTESTQKAEEQANAESNGGAKTTVQSNQQIDKVDFDGTSAPTNPQATHGSTPTSKVVHPTSTDSDTETITVYHYKKGTTESLAPDDELPVTAGQTYSAKPKEMTHYRLVNQVNTTGIYSGQEAAYFYYEPKSYQIKIKYQVKFHGAEASIAGRSVTTWTTKVLNVPYGKVYTIPVLNLESSGLYVVKQQLPKSLTGIMEGKPLNVTITYGGLTSQTVWHRQNDTLTHYLTEPNGTLQYAELDENESSHTLLMFTFPQSGKRIEMVMINNDNGDHVQKLYLVEGQRLTVTLLDGSRHIIQVKNGVIYDRALDSKKQAKSGRQKRPMAVQKMGKATVTHLNGTGYFKDKTSKNKVYLPKTGDQTNAWPSMAGLGLLVLASTGHFLSRKKRD
ncbi:LPXTG cell wall anchor domain-containing protein [Levilactobacillus sp. N40-8-2]|uniref:LPXTG cell wall anchor domain-containing protein n=1 Tax=Levilactobacillus muriae TaxID=3238987 RepID=UPI0038B3AEEB